MQFLLGMLAGAIVTAGGFLYYCLKPNPQAEAEQRAQWEREAHRVRAEVK
jgi:hypothetical protein